MAELKNITDLNQTNGHINRTFYDQHPEFYEENGVDNSKTDSAMDNVKNKKEIFKEMSKVRIVKNLLVLSFGFLLLFTAFQSLSNLESSVNQALGTMSLSAIYAGLVFSSMFVPAIMISVLGQKYTVVVSMVMYSFYFVANFHPEWYTLIPTAVILGFAAAPLWTAKASYVTIIAEKYAGFLGQPSEAYVVRFFGVFYMIFQTAQIWGNFIAYMILTPTDVGTDQLSLLTDVSHCGASFCDNWTQSGGNDTVDVNTIPPNFNLLCGIYTGCALMAVLVVIVFLDPLDKKDIQKPSLTVLVATLRHLKNPYQLLLVPVFIFGGMTQAFIVGDFTKAFVTCAWGVNNVGYVMICFGVTNAIFSLGIGIVKFKTVGRILIMLVGGGAITGSMIVLMYLWVPTNDGQIIYFIIAGFWGIGDAVWGTYLNALCGVMFPYQKEAAFANYRLWGSIGFIISFAWSSYLCMRVKLSILLVLLIVALIAYLAIEIHQYFGQRSSRDDINNKNSCSASNRQPP